MRLHALPACGLWVAVAVQLGQPDNKQVDRRKTKMHMCDRQYVLLLCIHPIDAAHPHTPSVRLDLSRMDLNRLLRIQPEYAS